MSSRVSELQKGQRELKAAEEGRRPDPHDPLPNSIPPVSSWENFQVTLRAQDQCAHGAARRLVTACISATLVSRDPRTLLRAKAPHASQPHPHKDRASKDHQGAI